MKETRIVIKVYGLVQGVFFRYTTRKIARKLGLSGYVKNMHDGSVLIDAEGPDDKLKELLALEKIEKSEIILTLTLPAWTLKELLNFSRKGPMNARVDRVEHEFKTPQYQFNGFNYSF